MDSSISLMKVFDLDSEPHFASETLKAWDDINFVDLQPFVKEHYWCGNESINIFRVVGTSHPDYARRSWMHLLTHGKRMKNINIPYYQNNPNYYLETCPKNPYMHYKSIDGADLYIGAEGNHRTTIAKFDFFKKGITSLHGVTLDDYRIDWEFKRIYDAIRTLVEQRGLKIYLSMKQETVERQDTAAWKLDKFKLIAIIRDARRNENLITSNHSELEQYFEILKKPSWKFW